MAFSWDSAVYFQTPQTHNGSYSPHVNTLPNKTNNNIATTEKEGAWRDSTGQWKEAGAGDLLAWAVPLSGLGIPWLCLSCFICVMRMANALIYILSFGKNKHWRNVRNDNMKLKTKTYKPGLIFPLKSILYVLSAAPDTKHLVLSNSAQSLASRSLPQGAHKLEGSDRQ